VGKWEKMVRIVPVRDAGVSCT